METMVQASKTGAEVVVMCRTEEGRIEGSEKQ